MPKKEQTRTIDAQKAMYNALVKSLGVVTIALTATGVSRSAFYQWLREDEEYKALIESIGDIALDFAENKLHKLIEKGDTASTIFYLKTKGKKRGYVEKQEIDLNPGSVINVSLKTD
jgi:hypothetical protein